MGCLNKNAVSVGGSVKKDSYLLFIAISFLITINAFLESYIVLHDRK